MATPATLILPNGSVPAKMTVEVSTVPRMLDIVVVLVIVVVLAVALGYSSQFLALLNAQGAAATSLSAPVSDMRETFRSMSIAVVVITTLLLAAIIIAFIVSAVKSSETAQAQASASQRAGMY